MFDVPNRENIFLYHKIVYAAVHSLNLLQHVFLRSLVYGSLEHAF